MRVKTFLTGIVVGATAAYIWNEWQHRRFISSEQALQKAKEAFQQTGDITGSWIQTTVETIEKMGYATTSIEVALLVQLAHMSVSLMQKQEQLLKREIVKPKQAAWVLLTFNRFNDLKLVIPTDSTVIRIVIKRKPCIVFHSIGEPFCLAKMDVIG